MPPLSVCFVVQGEGRGHMTQAVALSSFLRSAGHTIDRVLIGSSPHRSTPSYFAEAVGAPVESFQAPTQVPDADGRAFSPGRTALDAARRSPRFVKAALEIAEKTRGADVVVNFLDLMGALSRLVSRSAPSLAIAHNYVFLHPGLTRMPGPAHVRRLVLAYARATAAGAAKTVALSFDALPQTEDTDFEVVPPLLRPGLAERSARNDGFLLAYALNAGYADAMVSWHRTNPEVELHCYVEGGAGALRSEPAESFHAHELSDERFLDHLARCAAYVGSAGFESICEAHYFGKPVLAVPTEGHFEQELNAWDAERVGAAKAGSYRDADAFWRSRSEPDPISVERFRAWTERAPEMVVDAVERTAAEHRR